MGDVKKLLAGIKERPSGTLIQISVEMEVFAEEMTTAGSSSDNQNGLNSGMRLNPEWVELLMGFPQGWTDISIGKEEFRELSRIRGTAHTDLVASATQSFRRWLNMSEDALSTSTREQEEGIYEQ